MTPFDYKDENSFRFSLFVDVRFKLCSVLNLDTSMKHSLLFRNTWHNFFVLENSRSVRLKTYEIRRQA